MSRRSNLFGVGIVSASLPSWADYTALPVGNFIEFTTNVPEATGVLMKASVLANWCGGTFVPDYGVRGAVVYWGGGEHNATVDSRTDGSQGAGGAYVLDCETRVYSRKCYQLDNNTSNRGDPTTGTWGGSWTDDYGAYADGSPQARHTYNCLSYMPAAWGGGSSGSLVRVAQSGGESATRFDAAGGVASAHGYSATWRFDLSKDRHSIADPSIFKITGSAFYDFGNGTPANVNESIHSCIDLTREGWWATSRQANGGGKMVFTSKAGVVSAPQGVSRAFSYVAFHHFDDDDTIVGIEDANYDQGQSLVWRIMVWQAGTNNPWVEAPINRQVITDVFPPGAQNTGQLKYPGVGEMRPQWSTILNCFVGLDYFYPYNVGTPNASTQKSTTIRVWKFTPPPVGQRATGTWQVTWELVTAKSGTEATNFMHLYNGDTSYTADSGTINCTFGRLVECPSLRAFIWTRDESKPGQLIRLQGM
jgi:hypothetical protein